MGKDASPADRAGQRGRQRHAVRWGRAAASALLAAPLLIFTLPSGSALAASGSVSVSVPAKHWIYTSVKVKVGEVLRITATGSWTDGATTSGPNGAATPSPDNFFNLADLGVCDYCAKTATTQWGALIGFIGTSPPADGSYTSTAVRPRALKIFYVGGRYEARVLTSGMLWLNKNADAYSGYISDNSGHVDARITVLPPESARQSAARARVAAFSVSKITALQQAANFCTRSVLDAFSSAAITAALRKLLPGAGDVFDGATIIGDTIEISYDQSNGQIGNATFDLGKLVFAVLGEVPGLELFGIVGDPAIDCTEAGFWLTGQLGGQLGKWLRHKLDPPSTATARIQGTWTLTRSSLTCINFPAGCKTTPIPIRLSNCTKTRCVMSRTDGVWKRSHPIERHGSTWIADFTDIAITCRTRSNPAEVIMKLSVVKASKHNGVKIATALGGTYATKATTNPPDCKSNGRALDDMYGSRP